jgi:hypothetical protein
MYKEMSKSIPENLDFASKMASIGYKNKKRVIQEPINGTVFTFSNNGPELPIYGNKPNSFTDNTNMMMYADIVNTNATANCTYKFEGRVGTGGCIKNLYIRSAGGEVISNIKNYHLLYAMKLQQNATSKWYDGKGRQLYRHASTPFTNANGTLSVSGGATPSITSALPLTMSSFFDCKYWILEGQTTYISMDLESSLIAAIGGNAACTATDLQLQNVRLVYDVYEMEPAAWNSVKSQYGGVFNYYGKEYLHRTDSLATNATEITTTLGWKKKYLTKLLAGLRSTAQTTAYASPSLTNRNQALVTEYSLSHDGSTLGEKAIEYKSGVLTYGEIVKSNGGIWDMHADELNTDGLFTGTGAAGIALAGTSDATVGSYMMELDFESLFQDQHSLSGIEVYNSLQFNIKKTSVNQLTTLDIFGEYSSQIVLDLNQNGQIFCPDNK